MDFYGAPSRNRSGDAVQRACAPFDDDYWLKKDRDGGFPHDFHQALAEAGWLGIAMPRNSAVRVLALPRPL